MSAESLEDKITRADSPIRMLRDSREKGSFKSPYPDVHSNWQDEQRGWIETATLFDQSHHMTDVYFRGSDVGRLMSDTATNSFATYGANKAKHAVICAPSGHMIGTAILFGLEEEEASLVGPAGAANWVQYQAETRGYDVEIVRDERTQDNPGQRLTYRYEIEGPRTHDILSKAQGRPFKDLKFFAMADLDLGGHRVRALSHTMAAVPGSESMGIELWGPLSEGPAVLEALLKAGEEFGLVRGGGLAYYSGSIESGYQAQPLPAIFTGDDMRPYREWLPADGYEGKLSVGGSYRANDIEDYCVTPYDFGYGHLVKFDHEFIGRDALEQAAKQPHRKKVWLRWNNDDVARVYASSLFGGEARAKSLDTPLGRYARVHLDAVLSGDRLIGISTFGAYTVNMGGWASPAFIDEADAQDGAEVTLLWGEENGGTAKRNVEPHVQTPIRATISTRPPVAH